LTIVHNLDRVVGEVKGRVVEGRVVERREEEGV
jgi:hypothetical protein